MFTAIWNGHEIARAARAIEVENTLYLPPDAMTDAQLVPAVGSSVCEWKGGTARYFDVATQGDVNAGAAWSYPRTGPAARAIEGWLGFWKGIEVRWTGTEPAPLERLAHAVPNVARALGESSVHWRPQIDWLDPTAPFQGYHLPAPDVLVDVLAEPDERSRASVIEAARARARRVAARGDGMRYIAVWGSAMPSKAALAALESGYSVLDLGGTAERIETEPHA